MALIEVDGCVFDEAELPRSHGFESLDPIGREAFVNHLHLRGEGRESRANRIIEGWAAEMRSGWPGRTFRIYLHVEADEVTVRFHMVRPGEPNWCEECDGVEIMTVGDT